mgnify:CR=1 FL=1
MITTLLWCCPLCGADDSLRARRQPLRPQTLSCQSCGARWRVRRVPGQDYQLRVIAGSTQEVGLELPLAAWYARLKANLTLVPRPFAIPSPLAGEEAYAGDAKVRLVVRRSTPLPPLGKGREVPEAWPPGLAVPLAWQSAGEGWLYLTNRRLIWQTPRGGYDFWWPRVRSAFTFLTLYYGIHYGEVAYRFRPPQHRVLKWLTYTARLAEAEKLPIEVAYH